MSIFNKDIKTRKQYKKEYYKKVKKRAGKKKQKSTTADIEAEGTPSNHLGAAGKGGWGANTGFKRIKKEVYKDYPAAGDY